MEFSRNNLSPLIIEEEGCFVEISLQNGKNT